MPPSRSLNVTITGETSPSFKRAVGDADRSLGKLGTTADHTGKRTSSMFGALGSAAKTGFGAVAAGAAAAGAGMVAFGKVAIDAASDVNESITKNRTLFGQYAKDIEAFAKTSATQFGISKRAALEYTGVFGNLARAIGISQKQSAGMSIQLTKLAADLASFNNTSIDDALEALRSGLTGETEPMRRFGVALSATAVQAEAVRAGIVKLAGDKTKIRTITLQQEAAERKAAEALKEHGRSSIEYRTAANAAEVAQKRLQAAVKGTVPDLNNQQKAMATVSLITRQTRIAQGDFARTSGGLANQQRILTARIEDLKASLGQALLPTVTKAITKINDFATGMQKGTGAGGRFRRELENARPQVEAYFRGINDVVEALGPYVKAASSAVHWTREHKNVLKALDAVTHDPIENMKFLADALNTVSGAAQKVAHAIGSIVSAIKGLPSWIGKASGLFNALGDGLGRAGDGIGSLDIGSAALAGGNSLMGAKSIMAPLAGMAGRFGLHTSSGLRPGAVTSSGNTSWHASGNAIDEAGTPAGMLGYFRFLKNTMGPQLRELIYTPGGVGIKDGHPYRYTGQVAADHYDHVHVAFTGDGHGRGDGIGDIRSLWTSQGGRASAANIAAAIAMAESGGNPNASNRNSNGSIDRGLWQINSVHGALSTFNRAANARAAIQISGNGRNWNPWTVYKTGAYKRFLTSGGGSGGTTSKSKGSTTIRTGPGSGQGIGEYDPESIYGGIPTLTSAQIRAGVTDAPLLTGDPSRSTSTSIKGRSAPIKGVAPGTARDTGDAGDPNQALIDAINALTAAEQERIALENQRIDLETNLLQQARTERNVSQSQYAILAQAITDVVSTRMGSTLGLGLSGLRSPAGSVART